MVTKSTKVVYRPVRLDHETARLLEAMSVEYEGNLSLTVRSAIRTVARQRGYLATVQPELRPARSA